MKYIVTNTMGMDIKDVILLKVDNWDDYHYKTTFNCAYISKHGAVEDLGTVKIGKSGMEKHDKIIDFLPKQFHKLSGEYFSVWQSADSYQKVRQLEEKLNANIFRDLNDISYNLELLDQFLGEPVMTSSLLRSVSIFMCKQQFHRITRGEAKLTSYRFDYIVKHEDDLVEDTVLDFTVNPESFPPTNIHVLIGRNGIGKTRLIKNMISSICGKGVSQGNFVYPDENGEDSSEHFEGVLCVAFSPFDDFSCLEPYEKSKVKCSYIGVKKEYDSSGYEDGCGEISLLEYLKNQFILSFKNCMSNKTKRDDWNETIKILESDPMFAQYNLRDFIYVQESNHRVYYSNIAPVEELFESLSSGHKVVLSIVTCCIDKLAEKTVLFIDEPETHLHPPLIASMIRSISGLLIKRNGVSIISTHSPIILQEVPKSCVWLLNREGNYLQGRRPAMETFGANIGSLTNEVFGYEIRNSGFHMMLRDAVNRHESYEDVLKQFHNQLGDEAKSMVRILFSQKEQDEE